MNLAQIRTRLDIKKLQGEVGMVGKEKDVYKDSGDIVLLFK